MTDDRNVSTRTSVTVPRGALIGIAAGAAILLVAIGVLVGVLLSNRETPSEPTPTHASSAPSEQLPSRAPSAPAEPAVETYAIGDPVTVGPVTLTINSFEVVDTVQTNDGVPLTPDAGGQLVVFHTTYLNSKNQADLSCGSTDLYIQVYDEQGLEMAPVFETYRIPGNPECNAHQLQNQPREWTFVFQSVAGAKPTIVSLLETLSYTEQEVIVL
jgi:hypothetical protein